MPAATLAAAAWLPPTSRPASFKGVVTFKGTPPAPKLVHKKDDAKIEKPEDRAVCAGRRLLQRRIPRQ